MAKICSMLQRIVSIRDPVSFSWRPSWKVQWELPVRAWSTSLAHGCLMWFAALFLQPFLYDWPTNVCEFLYMTCCWSCKSLSGHFTNVMTVTQCVSRTISIWNTVVEKFFNYKESFKNFYEYICCAHCIDYVLTTLKVKLIVGPWMCSGAEMGLKLTIFMSFIKHP